MKLYAMDTDIVTLFQEGNVAIRDRVLAEPLASVTVTVATVEEQLSGWYTQLRKAKSPERLAWAYRRLAESVQFLSHFRILLFDEPAIRRCEEMRNSKLKIGRFDMRIASTALEHGAVLVSRNVRDFGRVPGLIVEDWTK